MATSKSTAKKSSKTLTKTKKSKSVLKKIDKKSESIELNNTSEHDELRERVCLTYKLYFEKENEQHVSIVSSQALPIDVRQYIGSVLGKVVLQGEVAPKKVDGFIRKAFYEKDSKMGRLASSLSNGNFGSSSTREQISVDFNDAIVVQIVNGLLEEALRRNASDIHIEPFETEMITRFRVDGKLLATLKSPVEYFEAVSVRIKYLAKLDVTQKLMPLDGKASIEVGGENIDLRVSTIPTKTGESIALRLLRKNLSYVRLDRVGLDKKDELHLREVLSKGSGLIVSTGPTGSGKSTTLYSMLQVLNDGETKIITVEDPVEYEIKGINQVEVNVAQGVTFPSILRNFLRHDPDVIMVGEIRDEETAKIAIQASLTGHLVLTTLHTKDSISAITRLMDLGVEPHLVASSLKVVMAQRLVPAIKGGRVGLIEYLPLTDKIKELMTQKDAEQKIRGHLKKLKFETLEIKAGKKVKSGILKASEAEKYLE